jgi:hypothetical protein
VKLCEVDECERKHYGRGWCSMHYKRWAKHGDPMIALQNQTARGLTSAERLAARSVRRGQCLIYAPEWNLQAHRSFNALLRGRNTKAHIVAWELANQREVPAGMCVCHRCDVPACIEPTHLFLGTVADNNADRDAKGRTVNPRGSRHGCAKLTEYQVQEIRAAVDAGEHWRSVAARYGIRPERARLIARRQAWRHVQEPIGAAK